MSDPQPSIPFDIRRYSDKAYLQHAPISEEHRRLYELTRDQYAVAVVSLQRIVNLQDGGCSCHINPPCSWCTSLIEEEVDIFYSEGRAALNAHWNHRVEKLSAAWRGATT